LRVLTIEYCGNRSRDFSLSVYPRLTQLSASSSSPSSRRGRWEEVIARDERVQATLLWSAGRSHCTKQLFISRDELCLDLDFFYARAFCRAAIIGRFLYRVTW